MRTQGEDRMTKKTNRKMPLAGRRGRQATSQAATADERRLAAQAEINRQLRRWPPRRIAAWALFVLAGVIAAQHVLAHLGFRPLPWSMAWQDLLVGYPTAVVVVIAGAIVLEPRRAR